MAQLHGVSLIWQELSFVAKIIIIIIIIMVIIIKVLAI
jgi:hypothetical protein